MICFFNTTKAWGGGEKWHLEIAAAMASEGIPVIVAAGKDSVLQKKATANNLATFSFKITGFSFLNPFLILRLRKFFVQKGVTTVVLNLPSDLKAAGIAARLAGVERIIYRRGSAIPVKNSFLNRFLFRNIITEGLANSFETKRTILLRNQHLIDSEKIIVIYNGIEVSGQMEISRKPANAPVVIGNLGRLEKQKAQHLLVQLGAKLKEAGYQFQILIGGDGSLRDDLEKQVRVNELTDFIQLIGNVENVAEFMGRIDIFVLTSHWEGFGYVLAEAMAAGKPVVTFNHSSNPEVVEDQKTGFLAIPGDIDDLYQKTVRLIEDESLRIEMGKAGRERVLRYFDFTKNYQKIREFLLKKT